MIRELKDMTHCDYRDAPRTDNGCLHCVCSMKLGSLWLCTYQDSKPIGVQPTCTVVDFDDGVDEGMDGEWHSYAPPTWTLSCGHVVQGDYEPSYCIHCGAEVVGE